MAIDLDLLLKAYASGIFPMADDREDPDIFWVEPKNRAIIPLDGFRMSRSLRKIIAGDRFRVSCDTAFGQVIDLCAESAADRPQTWINEDIEQAFLALHERGLAHSVECWQYDEDLGQERLAGGLYGLEISNQHGGIFCGESMFSRASNASKTALAWLVARLKYGGFSMLDCQFMTEHLASLGAIDIPQVQYVSRLRAILNGAAHSTWSIKSPIGSGAGSALGGAGGLALGGAALGAAGVAVGGAAGASSGANEVSFSALDELLVTLDDAARGVVGSSAASGASSSPGKLIAQLLTQTS